MHKYLVYFLVQFLVRLHVPIQLYKHAIRTIHASNPIISQYQRNVRFGATLPPFAQCMKFENYI